MCGFGGKRGLAGWVWVCFFFVFFLPSDFSIIEVFFFLQQTFSDCSLGKQMIGVSVFQIGTSLTQWDYWIPGI